MNESIDVVLLAAGLGSRLKPITNTVPKCLVPINEKALLDYWLDMLVPNANIGSIFINVCYLKHQVVAHLQKHWSHYNKIKIWHEKELLGTAGTLCLNRQEITTNDTLIIHADNLSKFDLDQFIQAHLTRPKQCLATMMLFKTDTPSSCGIVELDKNMIVTQMFEKVEEPPGNLANGAVYIFTSEVLDWLVKHKAYDISCDVIPAFLSRIYSWQNTIYHRDIGTPKSYQLAQLEFKRIAQ